MKKSFAIVLLLITILALCIETSFVQAQTGQVTLKPTQDAYTDSKNPNSNFGGQTYLQVETYQYTANQTTHNYQSVVWLKFNLSSVPTGAIIDGATLQLYISTATQTYAVHACYCSDDSWTELGITRANMPTVGFISVDAALVGTGDKWCIWNVSGAVNFAKINNNLTALTIALIEPTFHGSSSWVWFYSREAPVSVTDYSPKLTIHWSGVIPEFQAVMLLPFLMMATTLIVLLYRTKNKKITAKQED
jgi:hypothetical protein